MRSVTPYFLHNCFNSMFYNWLKEKQTYFKFQEFSTTLANLASRGRSRKLHVPKYDFDKEKTSQKVRFIILDVLFFSFHFLSFSTKSYFRKAQCLWCQPGYIKLLEDVLSALSDFFKVATPGTPDPQTYFNLTVYFDFQAFFNESETPLCKLPPPAGDVMELFNFEEVAEGLKSVPYVLYCASLYVVVVDRFHSFPIWPLHTCIRKQRKKDSFPRKRKEPSMTPSKVLEFQCS